jgi:hypothetical protein
LRASAVKPCHKKHQEQKNDLNGLNAAPVHEGSAFQDNASAGLAPAAAVKDDRETVRLKIEN